MKTALKKTITGFTQFLPIFFSVVLLLSLMISAVPKAFYTSIFSGNLFWDPLLGAFFGSISGGNPITGYVLAGELLAQNVSLLAVTAFLLAWVTVGLIQLPAESIMLGKKFAIIRNIVSFFMAIIIATLTIITLSFL